MGRVVRGATSNAIGIITKLHDDEAEPYYYIKPVSGYFRLGSEDLESYDDVCIGGVIRSLDSVLLIHTLIML